MNDFHQRRMSPSQGIIELIGSMSGLHYAVRILIKERIITWLDDVEITPDVKDPVKMPKSKKAWTPKDDDSDCPGCHNWFLRLAKGAKGLLKISLGVDGVEETVYSQRRTTCLHCDRYNGFGICNECGCVLEMKTRLGKEACPIDKWTAITIGKS